MIAKCNKVWHVFFQAQDLSSESDGDIEEGPMPGPALPSARDGQAGSNSRLSWSAAGTNSMNWRPPKAGPGLSLKQQASSPRWSARRGIGSALVSPGLASRQGNDLSALPRRSIQARPSSQLGLPVRSRRAVSEDEPEAKQASAETWRLSRAQSVAVTEPQRQEWEKPFIELSDLAMPAWAAAPQEAQHVLGEGQPEDDYGDWADASRQQEQQDEDPKQRLLL